MSNHQIVISPIQNSTCRHVGHEWKSGLDPHYRTCTRLHCRVAERFVNDEWIETTRQPSTCHKQPVISSVSPVLLWSSSRPSDSDPVRDREQERHANALEQRYYKAVADEAIYRAALTRR